MRVREIGFPRAIWLRLGLSAPALSSSWTPFRDCYWVGSLDFKFLGNQGGFHSTPEKSTTFGRGVVAATKMSGRRFSRIPRIIWVWVKSLPPQIKPQVLVLGSLHVPGQAVSGTYFRPISTTAPLSASRPLGFSKSPGQRSGEAHLAPAEARERGLVRRLAHLTEGCDGLGPAIGADLFTVFFWFFRGGLPY